MLLNEVTGANLERLKRETDVPNREFFIKMLARAKTENALYAVLVSVMADTAKAERITSGVASPEDIHRLVIDVGMLCLRALELAMLDGKVLTDAEKLMQDPQLFTLDEGALLANVEMKLLIGLLRNKPSEQ